MVWVVWEPMHEKTYTKKHGKDEGTVPYGDGYCCDANEIDDALDDALDDVLDDERNDETEEDGSMPNDFVSCLVVPLVVEPFSCVEFVPTNPSSLT